MSKVDKLGNLLKKKSSEEIKSADVKVQMFTESAPQANSHAELQVEPKTKTQAKQETDNDPATILLSRVKQGAKKQRMEDQRIRRTYWLTPEEIQMIDSLAEMTGMDKYEVVGLAVQSMYKRALDSQK